MPPDSRNPLAFGYKRCSHEDSVESGLGLDIQDEQIQTYYTRILASKLGWGGIETDEETSAWKRRFLSRKRGRLLHEKLCSGDHLIFAKIDRAFRSMSDAAGMTDLWTKQGITVHFVDMQIDLGTPMGKYTFHVLCAGAELQAGMTSVRNRETAARMKRLGRCVGGLPVGMMKEKLPGKEKGGRLVWDPNQLMIGKWIEELHAKGWGFPRISQEVCQRLSRFYKDKKYLEYPRLWSRHRCEKMFQRMQEWRTEAKAAVTEDMPLEYGDEHPEKSSTPSSDHSRSPVQSLDT